MDHIYNCRRRREAFEPVRTKRHGIAPEFTDNTANSAESVAFLQSCSAARLYSCALLRLEPILLRLFSASKLRIIFLRNARYTVRRIRITTKVRSARNSIKARPRIRKSLIVSVAPGFLETPSHAAVSARL
jgi:hypothetical protein